MASKLHYLVSAAWIYLATPALAQGDAAAAREAMIAGDKKLEANDGTGALADFERADKIMHVPSTGVAVAKALAQLKRYVEACAKLEEVAKIPAAGNEPAAFKRSREEANRLLPEYRNKVGRARVRLAGLLSSETVEIKIDEQVVDADTWADLDPGTHKFIAKTSGGRTAHGSATIMEGESRSVDLQFATTNAAAPPAGDGEQEPEATEPDTKSSNGRKKWVWIGYGVGGVGAVAGIVTGALSISQAKKVKDKCEDKSCPASEQDNADKSTLLANISNGSFALALIGAGVGTWALLTSSDEPSEAAVEAHVGPTGLSVSGRF